MNGLLLVDKPQNWTSFDVVNKIRGQLTRNLDIPKKSLKVGHTGTLDPLATGLLVLTIGSYCKRANEFMKLDKTYNCTFTLGKSSSSDDLEGDIEDISSYKPQKSEAVEALNSFCGPQSQIPPQYSAIKIAGQRAYKQARKGQVVKLKPRKITVYSIENVKYKYPLISCNLTVSSGTYIRSIARDYGKKLKTGAYLSQLRRTKVGEFNISQAKTIEQLLKSDIEKLLVQA